MNAETLIRASWFYRDDSQKTYLNWFLFELSLKLHSQVRGSNLNDLKRWRARLTDMQVAEFCAYYAKRMRVSVLENVEGGSGIVALYDTYLADYCHENSKKEDGALGKVAAAAWEAHLRDCRACNNMCVVRGGERCGFFDRRGRLP